MRTSRIQQYIAAWKTKGYPNDIPDEVPNVLMKLGLAPSYKAIVLAILKNDNSLESLGFIAPVTKWYSAIKKVEIENRAKTK